MNQFVGHLTPGSILFLMLAFLIGLVFLQITRFRYLGNRWLWGIFLMYLGFSIPAASRLLSAPIVKDYTRLQNIADAHGAEAIIVLDSSTKRYENEASLLEMPDDSSVLRALEAARVYHLLDEPLVIVSGGSNTEEMTWLPEGSMLRDTLIRLGVPQEHIVLDSNSGNTRAHAVDGIKYLQQHGISKFVLVTSSLHMRRAALSFQMLGRDPIPSPSTIMIDNVHGWKVFKPSLKSLIHAEQVMHEYFGLVYYWLLGWV